MAGYSDDWKNELLLKNDIVDVISGYLPLKRKGDNYWAPCPWHAEKNPSFSVSSKKQMFYCFSCKKGGGVVNFIMEMEKLNYHEAVVLLAERVGMTPPSITDDKAYKEQQEYKKRLHALMRDAAIFYVNKLHSTDGEQAREYIDKRRISHVIKRFGIGYAPDSFNETSEYLKSLGYTNSELFDCSMVRSKKDHFYDTFRNRLIFPIQNANGDVVAFGGRALSDEDEPKYLNSPESVIFNKRKNLYALNLVRKQKGLSAIMLVEGYMDVVALAGAGILTSVASLGTSLTTDQARLVKRFSDTIYLCYDGDDAGKNAAVRAGEILESEGLIVHVIELPDGLDPDDVIKKWGANWFAEQKKSGKDPMEFKLNRLRKNYDMDDKSAVSLYATKAINMIAEIDNEIEKDRYVKLLAASTGVSEDTLNRQLDKNAVKTYNFPTKELNLKKKDLTDETILISRLIAKPSLISGVTECIEETDFHDPGHSKIFSYINRRTKEGILPTSAEIIEVFLGTDVDIGAFMAESPPEGTADMREYAQNLAKSVKRAKIKAEIDDLMAGINELDGEKMRETLGLVAKLQQQVRNIQ